MNIKLKVKKLILIVILLTLTPFSYAELSKIEQTYVYSLCFNLGNWSARGFGQIITKERKHLSDDFLDIFAEVAIREVKRETPRVKIAVMLRNALYASKNHRYDAALTEIIDTPIFDSRSIRRFVKDKSTLTQYVPGSIDLDKIKNDLSMASWQRPVIKNGTSIIKSLNAGDDLSVVFTKMGFPDATSINFNRASFFYKGAGAITISQYNKNPKVKEVFPSETAYEYLMPYFKKGNSSDPITKSIILYGLLSGDTKTQRALAGALYRQPEIDVEILDVFAQILADNYKSNLNSKEEDTYAWFVKLLGASNSTRYKNLITNVYETSPYKKLKKHASVALKSISDKRAEPFILDTVDLNTLKKETLSPYHTI